MYQTIFIQRHPRSRNIDTNRIEIDLVIFIMAIILYRNIFVSKLWPDFNKKDFYKIITKFNKVKRNLVV